MTTTDQTRVSARPKKHRRAWIVALVSGALLLLIACTIPSVRSAYHQFLGRLALSESNNLQALAHFQQAQAVDPGNPETQFWMARVCRKTGDLAGVQEHLSEARRLGYAGGKRLEREWWLVLAENGRIGEAENHLAEMLMNPGDDGSEICDAFSKGYCLNLMFSPAQKLLETWAADYPSDYRPYLRLAQIYAGRQQWALAIRELRQAKKRAPTQIPVQRELGRCLYKNNETEEAERELQSVVARDPQETVALMTLAQLAFDRNDHAKAVTSLQTLISAQPRDFPARLLLAKVSLAKGDFNQSISIAESLVSEWPEDLNAHYVLAQSLRAAGRASDAKHHFLLHAKLDEIWSRVETLTREINQSPTDPKLRYQLGLLLLRHVSREEGVAYLRSVFQFAPSHSGAQQALAEYEQKMAAGTVESRHRQTSGSHLSSFSTASSILPEDPIE